MPTNYQNTTRFKHAKRRFEYADVDKDGQLSVIEFLYFLNPEEGKHMRDALVLVFIYQVFNKYQSKECMFMIKLMIEFKQTAGWLGKRS